MANSNYDPMTDCSLAHDESERSPGHRARKKAARGYAEISASLEEAPASDGQPQEKKKRKIKSGEPEATPQSAKRSHGSLPQM